MKTPVRVRFAPSPTGFLHLGGMRSALFNWLYARQTGGIFILRLEDTDRERLVPEAIEQIKASHDWLGLTPDETATQSERLELYHKHATTLERSGHLYGCWCSPERLDDLRQQAREAKQAFKYDRHCLDDPGDKSQPHVLRFRIPDDIDSVSWTDAVRGELSFKRDDLDDFVALKSDGYPTYNFANVVDDHEMAISHVLRAEEFLSSTPKHILIYQAFGWEPPVFAHLPQVLGPDGSKLSKRHGAKPALDYRDEGYLPEAIINFLALLGWNPGEGSTKELYTTDELIQAFSLERIQKSPAVFDPARLDWMNGEYIRAMALDELFKRASEYWPATAKTTDDDYRQAVLALVQDRLKRLAELPQLSEFFFDEPSIKRQDFQTKQTEPAEAWKAIERLLPVLSDESVWQSAEGLEAAARAGVGDDKPGPVFMSLRIAITGQTATPPLFETMTVLGRERVLTRLEQALAVLAK